MSKKSQFCWPIRWTLGDEVPDPFAALTPQALRKMALAHRSAVGTCARPRFAAARPVTARPRVAARATVSEVTDSSFAEDVLKSKTPVLVDFWAPCKFASPGLSDE